MDPQRHVIENIKYAGYTELTLLVVTMTALLAINDRDLVNNEFTNLTLYHLASLGTALPAITLGCWRRPLWTVIFFLLAAVAFGINISVVAERWKTLEDFVEAENYIFFLLDLLFVLISGSHILSAYNAQASGGDPFDPEEWEPEPDETRVPFTPPPSRVGATYVYND
jgi:hypothetical protein